MSAPTVTLHHGDSLTVLTELAACSVDAIVTDPPYGLGFMGRAWDELPPGREWAEACLRVLKPGGHLLAFGGTRTWHRLAVAVEDAGFEIRDSIAWLYGSGFPKSLDVSKAIDKAAGAERPVLRERHRPMLDSSMYGADAGGGFQENFTETAPATPEAVQWQGWGTALKPAFEPVVVARKPLGGRTVAGNVLVHGTGALNIDATRIVPSDRAAYEAKCASVVGLDSNRNGDAYGEWSGTRQDSASPGGRWPANVVLDESQADALDQMSGITTSKRSAGRNGTDSAVATFGLNRTDDSERGHNDSGGASRFFYVAKAPKKERPNVEGVAHPTVKPLTLMRWLVRLVTPPGGLVLDPFAGSGATAEAAVIEGFGFIGIDEDPAALAMIRQRLHRQTLDPDRYTGPDPIATVTHPGHPTLFDQETV